MDSSLKEITVVQSDGSFAGNVFLDKLEKVIESKAVSLELWCWDRKPDSGDAAHFKSRVVLVRGGGGSKIQRLILFPYWIVRVFFAALLDRKKRRFFCYGFESAFPVALASLLTKQNFVFGNLDNISMSYRWPWAVKKSLEYMERFTAARAALHVMPSKARWRWRDDNIFVMRNTPLKTTTARAREIANSRNYSRDGGFTLYVNGWLSPTRGLKTLLLAMREVPEGAVKLLLAGKLICDEAIELSRLPGCDYRGVLDNDEALALYYGSHLAYTYYDPAVEINRFAEPNKWNDCIVTGTPFVVNSEVTTAEEFVNKKACFYAPYCDASALSKMLASLSNSRDSWCKVQDNLRQFEAAPWDSAAEELIDRCIRG